MRYPFVLLLSCTLFALFGSGSLAYSDARDALQKDKSYIFENMIREKLNAATKCTKSSSGNKCHIDIWGLDIEIVPMGFSPVASRFAISSVPKGSYVWTYGPYCLGLSLMHPDYENKKSTLFLRGDSKLFTAAELSIEYGLYPEDEFDKSCWGR